MNVAAAVLPVILMIFLGVFCKKIHLLNHTGIENIKSIIVTIILPVAVFHALATGEYGITTGIIFIIMLIMVVVSFIIGHLMRPLVPEPYSKYVPFMVSVYEGGMMAYPLYTNLCGAENLSRIALLDIGGILFGFSVYMGMLGQIENHEKINPKKLVRDAFHSPVFIAAVLGVIAGLTGVMDALLNMSAGTVYLGLKDMITAPLSPLILLVVGFDLAPNMELIKPCLRTIFLRMVLQGALLVCVLQAVHHFVGVDRLRDMAIILYMSAPASFSIQSYLKDPSGSAYASTINSLYCIITIVVYMVLATIM